MYKRQVWAGGEKPTDVDQWILGVDWAGSGVFAAVLIALDEDLKGTVVAERIYDARVKEPLTDLEQVRRTAKWAYDIVDEGDEIVTYGDPTTPGAAQFAFTDHLLYWNDADNSVLEGISATSHALERLAHRQTHPTCLLYTSPSPRD